MNCAKCKWEIVDLKLTDQQRIALWGCLAQDMKLFAVKQLLDDGFSHRDAKGIVDHLNEKHGKCTRCSFDELKGEAVVCPKCKAFNYNLDLEPSFNQEFCTHLEYKIDFDQLENDQIKGYWCDGVDHIPYDINDLTKQSIQQRKTIKTKAWAGKDGQTIHQMTILFGERSVEHYISGKNLVECIPSEDCKMWVKTDPENKQIEIKLL